MSPKLVNSTIHFISTSEEFLSEPPWVSKPLQRQLFGNAGSNKTGELERVINYLYADYFTNHEQREAVKKEFCNLIGEVDATT